MKLIFSKAAMWKMNNRRLDALKDVRGLMAMCTP